MLSIKNFSKSYRGGKRAVNNISIEVKAVIFMVLSDIMEQ